MAKRTSGGKHKTRRVAFQVPEPWANLARRIAAKNKQPTLWLIIALIAEAAQEAGEENIPPLPWEDGGDF